MNAYSQRQWAGGHHQMQHGHPQPGHGGFGAAGHTQVQHDDAWD